MITARTKLYAVVGDPVEKSLSPIMHNGWMQDHGIDATYVALRVRDAAALAHLHGLGFAGVNVTVPHKEAAFELATTHCPVAAGLRAANVLRFSENGDVLGLNTDAEGFWRSVIERWPDLAGGGQKIVMIGAGGAARAVGYACLFRNNALTIVNRTADKANGLVDLLARLAEGQPDFPPKSDVRALAWNELRHAIDTADVIVNAVTNDTAIAWDLSNTRARCVDLRYGTMDSHFLAAAGRANLETLDGLGMLIHQGALAFEHWFGVAPDTNKARARLLEALR